VLVMGDLAEGRRRFNELRRNVEGISQKMLSAKLRMLERDGLVERTFYAVIPPRVEYELTGLGQELLASLEGLAEFALMHQGQVAASRHRFDVETDSAAIAVVTLPRRVN
jgi:DNA-binding HxlR family transcriptional regulator